MSFVLLFSCGVQALSVSCLYATIAPEKCSLVQSLSVFQSPGQRARDCCVNAKRAQEKQKALTLFTGLFYLLDSSWGEA